MKIIRQNVKSAVDLNIGSDRNAAAVAWDEVVNMLGEQEFLDAVFSYFSTYVIEELITSICTDYDLDVYDEDDE